MLSIAETILFPFSVFIKRFRLENVTRTEGRLCEIA